MDQAEEVKSKVDLIEVISSYIPLKKAGRNFSGLCPFHGEKTPSLMVSPDRQVWKCFGCGQGGDVFTFVEQIEGWEFREVLEDLAQKVGVKLTSFKPSENTKVKEKLLEIHKLTAKFYKHLLLTHPIGAQAREYLHKRGIKKEIWELYGLGYAPAEWEMLLSFLQKRGFTTAQISQSGLVVSREGKMNSYYDRFRNRVMFPLCDNRGVVVGFSGRILDVEAREAKYINSPETPLFHKGSLLFGLDIARPTIREKNTVVLVEGEVDVLSSYQVGIHNVVASKGTAFTEKQVAIIARLCENIILCFDTDVAGDAASRRSIELLDIAGMNIRVVRLGKFKDPDEFARGDSKGFVEAVGNAVNVYDYFIESATSRFNPQSADGKKKIGNELLPVISKISDDLVRAHYVTKLANVLELDVNFVDQAVSKKMTGLFAPDVLIEERPKASHELEKYFLALFLAREELISDFLNLVSPNDFVEKEAQSFWRWFCDIIVDSSRPNGTKSIPKILAHLPERLRSFVDNLYLVTISPTLLAKERWADELVVSAKRIRYASFKRRLALIAHDLAQAQSAGDKKKVEQLAKTFDDLKRTIKEFAVGD